MVEGVAGVLLDDGPLGPDGEDLYNLSVRMKGRNAVDEAYLPPCHSYMH